jgi:hypothetical protein
MLLCLFLCPDREHWSYHCLDTLNLIKAKYAACKSVSTVGQVLGHTNEPFALVNSFMLFVLFCG